MTAAFLRMMIGGIVLVAGCGNPPAMPGSPDDAAGAGDGSVTDGATGDSGTTGDGGAMGDGGLLDDAGPTDGPLLDGRPLDGPIHTPGMPGLGAHGLHYYPLAGSTATSISVSMPTQPSGSVIVVGVGRGDNTKFVLPTDNKGNAPYRQVDVMHPYARWGVSGTALYTFPSATGGADFRVSTTTGTIGTGQFDEITIAAVEVIDGNEITSYAWNQPRQPPLRSDSVTTTGPATLIAFWWGDGFPGDTGQSAVPDNDFRVIESNAHELHSYVQLVVAVKNVNEAGSYNVTWTARPEQGAQLWLIAVQ